MQNLRGGQNFSFPTLLDSFRELLLNGSLNWLMFIHKTEVMNKGKSFLCALISETIRLLKYALDVLAF